MISKAVAASNIHSLFLFLSFSLFIRFTLSLEAVQLDNAAGESEAHLALLDLHKQLDDDNDGGIDPIEADDYVQGELGNSITADRTQVLYTTDNHITREELWSTWKNSKVHNWTVNDVIAWLHAYVGLNEYEDAFRQYQVTGRMLPRLLSTTSSLMMQLQIRNPVHRQILMIKATDVILFGPPKVSRLALFDGILVAALVVAIGGFWFALNQYRQTQAQKQRLLQEMAMLVNAEKALKELRQKLDEAERSSYASERNSIAEESKENMSEMSCGQPDSIQAGYVCSDLETMFKKDSVDLLCTSKSVDLPAGQRPMYSPLAELHLLLQITMEVEGLHFQEKKATAEHHLNRARELCERLHRKRGSLLSVFRLAHSSALDEVDRRITTAQAALERVRSDLTERTQRWRLIEQLLGLPFGHSPGLAVLRNKLLQFSPDSDVFRYTSLPTASVDDTPRALSAPFRPFTIPWSLNTLDSGYTRSQLFALGKQQTAPLNTLATCANAWARDALALARQPAMNALKEKVQWEAGDALLGTDVLTTVPEQSGTIPVTSSSLPSGTKIPSLPREVVSSVGTKPSPTHSSEMDMDMVTKNEYSPLRLSAASNEGDGNHAEQVNSSPEVGTNEGKRKIGNSQGRMIPRLVRSRKNQVKSS